MEIHFWKYISKNIINHLVVPMWKAVFFITTSNSALVRWFNPKREISSCYKEWLGFSWATGLFLYYEHHGCCNCLGFRFESAARKFGLWNKFVAQMYRILNAKVGTWDSEKLNKWFWWSKKSENMEFENLGICFCL